MSGAKQAIEELAARHLPDESHFLVEVKVDQKADKTLVQILVDADQGITIDACAKLSREMGEELEAMTSLGEAFVLEVSSPGLDYPLSSQRQYQKNIGRELKVLLSTGSEITGKLLAIDDQQIRLLVKHKEKGKKATEVESLLPLAEIKKSIVQVSFK